MNIPLYKDVTLHDWNDWNWQIANRITRLEELEQVIKLSPEERKNISMGLQTLRMAITPYYASLMDHDDPDMPNKETGRAQYSGNPY